MKTNASPLPGKERQPAAQTAGKGQGTGLSTPMGQDRRPEALVESQMQAMIRDSPQSRQAMQFQAMVGQSSQVRQAMQLKAGINRPLASTAMNMSDAPIQRKPLNPDFLNVVAEQHDDATEKLRVWEKKYTREKTGGAYFNEEEFKVEIPKPGGKNEEKVVVSGDPSILQMANAIHAQTNKISSILAQLERIHKVKPTKFNLGLSRTQIFGPLKLILQLLVQPKAFAVLHRKLKIGAQAELEDRPDLQEIYDVYAPAGDKFYNVWIVGVDAWATATDSLDKDTADEVALSKAVTDAGLLTPTAKELLVTLFEKENVPFEEHQAVSRAVTFKRSEEMHKAATIGKATKGVWKVGQSHVVDILTILDGSAAPYELMTNEEFMEDFTKWLEQNEEYQASLQQK